MISLLKASFLKIVCFSCELSVAYAKKHLTFKT